MAESVLPKGLIIDSIIPLLKGGEIDGRSFGKHLDRVLSHVQAIFIGSPYGGKGRELTPEQRRDLFEKTLVIVRGQVPVFAWITREEVNATFDMLMMFKETQKSRGYSGLVSWVDTPLFYHSNRGLPQHYEKMTSLVQETFILHNDPDLIRKIDRPLKRNNIRTSILKEIVQLDRVGGLIFSGTLDRVNNYQKAVRFRSDFRIYDGDESRFLEYPSKNGVVSIGTNLTPKAWQKITLSSLKLRGEGNYPDSLKQIWDAGQYLNNLRELYKEHGASLIKYALSDMGVLNISSPDDQAGEFEKERLEIKTLMQAHPDY